MFNYVQLEPKFSDELKDAQKIRRDRLEYDAMSKAIKEFPDRQSIEVRLAEIEADLEKSRKEETDLDEKLFQRKKQFHLLIQTIHQVFFSSSAHKKPQSFFKHLLKFLSNLLFRIRQKFV